MSTPPHDRAVLDTSAVIRLGEVDPRRLAAESVITTVTLAELSVGPLVAATASERAARQRHLQQAETDFGDPLPFDAEAARTFGPIAATLPTWHGFCPGSDRKSPRWATHTSPSSPGSRRHWEWIGPPDDPAAHVWGPARRCG